MRKVTMLLTVLGAVTVLVLAGNTLALATTGHGFILGHTNYANKQTTVARTTSGTALRVATKYASNSPFSVNGKGKVTNLNADLLDGFDSTTLRTHSYVYTGTINTPTTGYATHVPVPAGTYSYTFSAFLAGGSGSGTYCKLIRHHGLSSTNIGLVTTGSSDPGLSSAGTITVPAGDTVEFVCGGSSTSFATQSGTPIQVVLTPTTVVGSGALSAE